MRDRMKKQFFQWLVLLVLSFVLSLYYRLNLMNHRYALFLIGFILAVTVATIGFILISRENDVGMISGGSKPHAEADGGQMT